MPRRRVAVLAITIFLVAVSVQIADPRFGRRQPPTVDFSDPPAEIAATAAERFEYVDYAYRFDFAYSRDDEWQQMRMMRVDNSDREFYKEGPLGSKGVILYGTDTVTFVRAGADGPWRVTGSPKVIFQPQLISQQFLVERLQSANASIRNENASTLVIHVDSHPVKVQPDYPGNGTLVVDKNTGMIEFASLVYDTPNGPRYLRFILLETGVEVERPHDLPVSAKEVGWDLARGPLVDL